MAKTAGFSYFPRGAKVTVLRKLIWIETPRFQGTGCSECAWTFKPSGPFAGDSLSEMKEIYERLRDKEFAIHACAEHPRAKKAKG